jgi:hypothetical protein
MKFWNKGKIVSPIINSPITSTGEDDKVVEESDQESNPEDSKKDDLEPGVQPAGAPA